MPNTHRNAHLHSSTSGLLVGKIQPVFCEIRQRDVYIDRVFDGGDDFWYFQIRTKSYT